MSLTARRLVVICLMIAGCPAASTGAQGDRQGQALAKAFSDWSISFDDDAKRVYREDYESGNCDRIQPNSSAAVVSREDGATVHAGRYCLRGNFDPRTTDPITRKRAATKSSGLADIELSQAGVKDRMYVSYWWRLDATMLPCPVHFRHARWFDGLSACSTLVKDGFRGVAVVAGAGGVSGVVVGRLLGPLSFRRHAATGSAPPAA